MRRPSEDGSEARIDVEAAAIPEVVQLEGRVGRRVEREVTRGAVDVGGVVGAADEGIRRAGLRDLAKVAGDVEDLVIRDWVALKVQPIRPAVLQGRRSGRQEAVLIASECRVEVVGRAKVAAFGRSERRGARGASRVVAPRARRGGNDLASGGPFCRGADEATHGGTGLLDFRRRDVEPGQTVWHGTSAGFVEGGARRSAGLITVAGTSGDRGGRGTTGFVAVDPASR